MLYEVEYEHEFQWSQLLLKDCLAVFEKMQRDKTFRNRLIGLMPDKTLKMGADKEYVVSFFTASVCVDGVIVESADPKLLPSIVDDDKMKLIFEVSGFFYKKVMFPVVQISIPAQRSKW